MLLVNMRDEDVPLKGSPRGCWLFLLFIAPLQNQCRCASCIDRACAVLGACGEPRGGDLSGAHRCGDQPGCTPAGWLLADGKRGWQREGVEKLKMQQDAWHGATGAPLLSRQEKYGLLEMFQHRLVLWDQASFTAEWCFHHAKMRTSYGAPECHVVYRNN